MIPEWLLPLKEQMITLYTSHQMQILVITTVFYFFIIEDKELGIVPKKEWDKKTKYSTDIHVQIRKSINL